MKHPRTSLAAAHDACTHSIKGLVDGVLYDAEAATEWFPQSCGRWAAASQPWILQPSATKGMKASLSTQKQA